jgi:hypothetical protein
MRHQSSMNTDLAEHRRARPKERIINPSLSGHCPAWHKGLDFVQRLFRQAFLSKDRHPAASRRKGRGVAPAETGADGGQCRVRTVRGWIIWWKWAMAAVSSSKGIAVISSWRSSSSAMARRSQHSATTYQLPVS